MRGAAACALAAALVAGCDREVSLGRDDPLAVETANAGMDALLLAGPTARRVAAHRLTAERVERWFAAQEALDAQEADDPTQAESALDARGAGEDAIERAVEVLEDRPGAREAIEGAGSNLEEFVLTGLALHQALTASGPAAAAGVRRLAARNVRFVAEHRELLARFRTQRPARVAEGPAVEDTVGWYDPFADTLVYGAAASSPPDTVLPDTVVIDPVVRDSVVIDTLLPSSDTLPVVPRDSLGRPRPPPPIPQRLPPPVEPSPAAGSAGRE